MTHSPALTAQAQAYYDLVVNKFGKGRFLYDLSGYKTAESIIKVTCIKHDKTYVKNARSHSDTKYGCMKCSKEFNKITPETFTQRARDIYQDRYNYKFPGVTEFINFRENIIVICTIHGDNNVNPSNHLISKIGCYKCAKVANNSIRVTNEEFINKAAKVHNSRYSYELCEYTIAVNKVKIRCQTHGYFDQVAADHLAGSGCLKCVGRNKTTAEFIAECIKKHEYAYDYSLIHYEHSRSIIQLICREHPQHPFSIKAVDFLQGTGCAKCGRLRGIQKRRILYEDFITQARLTHGDKYVYKKEWYTSMTSLVAIECPKHNIIFSQRAGVHVKGSGCPECAKESHREKMRTPYASFIAQAIEVHKGKYTYIEDSYTTMRESVTIVCPIHGSFCRKACHHIEGASCVQCSDFVRTTEQFIRKSIEKHGSKYNYDKVIYVDCFTPVEIICNMGHGSFQRIPNQHMMGKGCPMCRWCKDCDQEMITCGRYCATCKPAHLNDPKQEKTKEYEILNLFQKCLPHNFIHNRSVGTAITGGHLYPDFRFPCEGYDVIVEVDEFGHRRYTGELARMKAIVAKLARPVVFIRYNPDSPRDPHEAQQELLETLCDYTDHGFDNIVFTDGLAICTLNYGIG